LQNIAALLTSIGPPVRRRHWRLGGFAPCQNVIVEVSLVRNRLRQAVTAARENARVRREQRAEGERQYSEFLTTVAVPVARLVVTALKADGYAFTLSTPAEGVRLADDRGRDDYIELGFDAAADPPQAIGRIRYTRGSRTLTDERPIKPGASTGSLSDEDVLDFLLEALEPWLER
jgi:hypothetical protein